MGHQVTIGGERLGSGKRMKVNLHGYERSTHDQGFVWKSTMSAGTLVPFMCEVGLPGDTFDIDLDVDIMTHPTIGPLFGTYKVQLDVFQTPIRLYNAKLHMNLLNVGLNMSTVALPQIEMTAGIIDPSKSIDNQQINPSSIFSHLNIRGLRHASETELVVTRQFNAIPWLGYWDIYKNYYANKQEEIGAVIHKNVNETLPTLTGAVLNNREATNAPIQVPGDPHGQAQTYMYPETTITIDATGLTNGFNTEQLRARVILGEETNPVLNLPIGNLFRQIVLNPFGGEIYLSEPTFDEPRFIIFIEIILQEISDGSTDVEPSITTFPLSNIDDMRVAILQTFQDTPFIIDTTAQAPYGIALDNNGDPENTLWSKQFSQEGLALKTYNSDLFNNWIQTEFIDGSGGINEITAISTAGASFTLDELNLKQKIYKMLNRIAISGGSYEDWLSAVYDNDKPRTAENPMYLGGLITNLVFQEIVSSAASADQPLGTLAGRGRIGNKRKGGQVTAKINEPSYIMGIVSITPNIDYSQGNKWDVNLKTLDDLHKPALDEIGFQDLITDQMAWWDTGINDAEVTQFKSAGKQPAWINYMTNVNIVRGNFADQTQQMFMVLTRRYNFTYNTAGGIEIADLTTYIDPAKFNYIFADTRRDAQNFWTQIGVGLTTRRKMSAKVMPNL